MLKNCSSPSRTLCVDAHENKQADVKPIVYDLNVRSKLASGSEPSWQFT